MWLSYIIPLYNCGKYIARCLDSILVQGLEPDDYEVIVVNDGSTDNGPEIVEDYCRRYSNFKLIHQENSGVGSARNRGLDEAKGDYVCFVDSDDWLYAGGIGVIKDRYASCSPDVVKYKTLFVDRYYNESKDSLGDRKEAFIIKSQDYVQRKYQIQICISCLILRKIIEKKHLRFRKYVFGEDTYFMVQLFLDVDFNILVTDLNIYRYYIRLGSAMNNTQKDYVEKFLRSNIDLINQLRIDSKIDSYGCSDALLFGVQWYTFSRIITSNFRYAYMKKMLQMSVDGGIFPIENPSGRLQRFINSTYKHPFVMYMLSKPCHILYPYYKRIFNHRAGRMPKVREFISSLNSKYKAI